MPEPEDTIRRALTMRTPAVHDEYLKYAKVRADAIESLDALLAERQLHVQALESLWLNPDRPPAVIAETARKGLESSEGGGNREHLSSAKAAPVTDPEVARLREALEAIADIWHNKTSMNIARAALARDPSQDRETPGWHQFVCRDHPAQVVEVEDTGSATDSPLCPECSKPMVLGGYRKSAAVRDPAPPPASEQLVLRPWVERLKGAENADASFGVHVPGDSSLAVVLNSMEEAAYAGDPEFDSRVRPVPPQETP